MGKHVRTVFLAILMVGLMVLPALAGTASVNSNGNAFATVSTELMGSPRTITITPAAGANAVNYTIGQNTTLGNIIQVVLTNATFAVGQYNICDNTGAIVAQFNSPGLVATGNFNVSATILVNTPLHLTQQACAAANQTTPFVLGVTNVLTNATIQFNLISAGAIPLDSAGPITFTQLRPEYSAFNQNSTHTIDVVAGTGTTFTPQTGVSPTGVLGAAPTVMADSGQGTGAVSPSIRINIVNNDINTGNTGPTTTFAQVTISDPNNFQGVLKVFIAAGGTPCDSTAATPSPGNLVQSALNPTTPSVTLTLPNQASGGFDQTTPPGVKDFTLCVIANGTDFLAPRALQASIDIQVPGFPINPIGCCNDPAPTPNAAIQTWNLSGGDIRISGIRADVTTNNNALININNLGPTDATIARLEVYRTQTIAASAAPACTVAPVPGVVINGRGGAQITGQQINALCLAQAPDLHNIVYAVRMVLTVAPGNFSANAFRQLPAGQFLDLPVLKLGNAFPND